MSRQRFIPKTKRAVDLVLSVTFITVLSPFILLAISLILITNIMRGRPFDPLLYQEKRFSHGQPFNLRKFNIFKYEQIVAARARGEFIETKYFEKNNGVTWIGWILKQIYMDELPQLFNVLIGEMSLVGPRPVNQQVYEKLLASGIDHKSKVRAGITGNFQSYKRVAGKDANMLDAEYVEVYLHAPWYTLLWFDCQIILRTLKVISKAEGA